MANSILNGRFEIIKPIGAGGMAKVFQAHDHTLDCTVAIKVMKPNLANDEYFIRQFANEARAAAGLTSPYVVGIRDLVEDGQSYYIVMEYVRGINLQQVLKKDIAVSPEKVAEIGSQVCLALEEAHARAIFHRDIKPSNIMLQPSGNIKVMDFGIAQSQRHSNPEDGQLIAGTVYYMSPEQIKGEQVAAASDIYSLGIVMYELVTRRLPFIGESRDDVARKQLKERPVAPMELNSDVDADLNAIILKAMEKDPASRYLSAAELRADLEEYLSAGEHTPSNLEFPQFWAAAITKGSEGARGRVLKIDRPGIIGRGETANFRIPDETVSGEHLRIRPFGRHLEIEDLNSSNGTSLDGKPVRCKTLCQAGANIDLGNVRIRIGQKM